METMYPRPVHHHEIMSIPTYSLPMPTLCIVRDQYTIVHSKGRKQTSTMSHEAFAANTAKGLNPTAPHHSNIN